MRVGVAVIISNLWNFSFKNSLPDLQENSLSLGFLWSSICCKFSIDCSFGNAMFCPMLFNSSLLLSYLQYPSTYDSPESRRKTEGPALQKGLDAIASSLNYIGGTIGNALEAGSYSLVFFCIIGGGGRWRCTWALSF